VAIEPERRLRVTHSCPLSGVKQVPENYHTLVYELAENVDMTHLWLSQDKNGSLEEAEYAKGTWQMMLAGLKRVIEGGRP
jgi:hypothetical protein